MRLRPRLVAAHANHLVYERRDGYLVTPPADFARLYKSPEALMAWARAGCPDFDETRPPTLTFDSFDQFRVFALKEGWSETIIERVRCGVLVLPQGSDAAVGGCINLQQFVKSGTWVNPNPVNVGFVYVQGCGGGGGGGGGSKGGSAATFVGGGGGGGSLFGGLTVALLNIPNNEVAVGIGAGGLAGNGGSLSLGQGGDAAPGGVTSFGTLASLPILAAFPGASGGAGGGDTSAGAAAVNNMGKGGSNVTSRTGNTYPIVLIQASASGLSGAGINATVPAGGGNAFNYQRNVPNTAAGNGGDNPVSTGNFSGGTGGTTSGGGGGGCGAFGSGGNGGNAPASGVGAPGASAPTNSGAGGGGGSKGGGIGAGVGGNGGNGGSGVLQAFW